MEYEQRRRRMDRARAAIRVELGVGFLAPAVLAFVFVAKPGTIGSPMFYGEVGWMTLLPYIGGAGVVFGLVWLVRLSHPESERGEVHWRYRDF